MKDILAVIGAIGVVAIALTAPNLLSVFRKPGRKQYSHHQIKRSLGTLSEKGLIGMSKKGDKTIIALTKDGRKKLLEYKIEKMKIKPQKHWDKRFRVVIFDVPERFRAARHAFSDKLKEIGLLQLQKSVWVTPYPCEDEIDFLKELYYIRPFVRVLTVEQIDVQHDLIRKFNL